MLVNSKRLKGFAIRAADGELGTVEQFYFDDESWVIRYFVVDTGGWLGGRHVLISPVSVIMLDWGNRRLDVRLTKKQVENSPDIDTDQPISRQHEAEYLGYYGYPSYWGGPSLWGPSFSPAGFAIPLITPMEATACRPPHEQSDSHLRSSAVITGYDIQATDGQIGHVDGFIVDDRTWAIRYVEVSTRNWWLGKKVLISPAWIQEVNWPESKVFVGLSLDAIRTAPEYFESVPITREYEGRLHTHYGRPPYWQLEAGHKPSYTVHGA